MNVESHFSGRIYLVVAVLIAAAMLLNACIPISAPIPAPPKAEKANPASVNCADRGGQLKIEKDAQGGEVGICIFPDGSQCEEWAFMRGECKPGQKPVAPDANSTLTGVVWTWQGLVMNNDTTKTPDDPAQYTLEFLADGKVSIKADCNRASGSYNVEGNKLIFGPLASTLAECQPGSLYNEYLKRLGDVQGYLIQDDKLILELKMDSGTLKFAPATKASTSGATEPGATNSVTGTSVAAVWDETLKNGRYELPAMEAGVFQMKDGKYENKYGAGASQVYRVELVTMATGDLTADGEEDAVVVLAWNGGGSGTFYRLVVVGNQGGTLQQIAAEPLGDRIQVKALKIQDGKISVDMLTHGTQDPACCPTQREMRTYRLDGSTLKVVS